MLLFPQSIRNVDKIILYTDQLGRTKKGQNWLKPESAKVMHSSYLKLFAKKATKKQTLLAILFYTLRIEVRNPLSEIG